MSGQSHHRQTNAANLSRTANARTAHQQNHPQSTSKLTKTKNLVIYYVQQTKNRVAKYATATTTALQNWSAKKTFSRDVFLIAGVTLVAYLGITHYAVVVSVLNKVFGMKVLTPASTVYAKLHGDAFNTLSNALMSLDETKNVVGRYQEIYTKKTGVKTTTPGILGIDAVVYSPYVRVNDAGQVFGLLGKTKLTEHEKIEANKDFDAFVKGYDSSTIKAYYAILFQPLDPLLDCFIIHMVEAHSGKSNENIVKILEKVASICDSNGFAIHGLGFDADSAYSPMTEQFVKDASIEVTDSAWYYDNFPPHLIFVDPLHLMKRARYRLIKHRIHCGLVKKTPILSIQPLRYLPDFNKYLVKDDKTTKMKDCLPIELFHIHMFCQLYTQSLVGTVDIVPDVGEHLTVEQLRQKSHELLGYLLPFTLFSTGISAHGIGLDDRIFCLKVAYKYAYAIYHEFDQPFKKRGQFKRMLQRGQKNTEMTVYDRQLIRDFLATTLSLLKELETYKKQKPAHSWTLNSCGSNPVEHEFGMSKIRSPTNNFYYAGKASLFEVEVMKILRVEQETVSIRGRCGEFGATLDPNDVTFHPGRYDDLDPAKVARELHHFFGTLIFGEGNEDGKRVPNPTVEKFLKYLTSIKDIVNANTKVRHSRSTAKLVSNTQTAQKVEFRVRASFKDMDALSFEPSRFDNPEADAFNKLESSARKQKLDEVAKAKAEYDAALDCSGPEDFDE